VLKRGEPIEFLGQPVRQPPPGVGGVGKAAGKLSLSPSKADRTHVLFGSELQACSEWISAQLATHTAAQGIAFAQLVYGVDQLLPPGDPPVPHDSFQ
jgi:hypothetical protein